jgi:hypothetical protein
MHVEVSVWGVSHLNGSGVLASAAEEKFSEKVAKRRRSASGRSQEKRAGAIPEQATELASYLARPEDAAVNVGSDQKNGTGTTRGDQALADSQCVEQAETGTADVERRTGFTSEKLRV